MLIYSDPNNMNSIVYHLIIERYSMKTLHWYFPWATALHLYNMTDRGEKLQQLHCYHPFSDSLDIYLTQNHYENYSPKMVPIAKIWGSGSWTNATSAWNESDQQRLQLIAGWKILIIVNVTWHRLSQPWLPKNAKRVAIKRWIQSKLMYTWWQYLIWNQLYPHCHATLPSRFYLPLENVAVISEL